MLTFIDKRYLVYVEEASIGSGSVMPKVTRSEVSLRAR